MSLAEVLAGQAATTAPSTTQQWLDQLPDTDRAVFWECVDSNYPTLHLHAACTALGLQTSESSFRRHLKTLERT